MKITALEEYGLRCLLQVAREPEGSLLTVSEIAQREALSSEYVAKIMSLLRRGELVESIRGVSGGYRLAKPAREISISALSSAVSNPLYVDGFCTGHRGLATECVHKDDCGIRFLWQEISGK
ncbi:MAG TPA: Rrf2 family transcriptional regulator, partial [Bdellovibrionota bacterium]|nr:Rrf2 family transcriptional regulator [Bdellovibrionota bacterium]